MPSTFSLARLLVAITLFCLLCGLAANFPDVFFQSLFLFGFFVLPSLLAWLAMVPFSNQRVFLSLLSILGAFGGNCFVWVILDTFGPAIDALVLRRLFNGSSDLERLIFAAIVATLTLPPLCTLLMGGTFLYEELRRRRKTNRPTADIALPT